MAFSEQIISDIAGLVQKYHYIANSPRDEVLKGENGAEFRVRYNIEINGDIIYIYDKNTVLHSKKLSLECLKEDMKATDFIYSRNIFELDDTKYSPFEADRQENSYYWGGRISGIDFPKFISIFLFSLLYCGRIPSFRDFHEIYKLSYIEELTNDVPSRVDSYNQYIRPQILNGEDRKNLGKAIKFSDGSTVENKLLKFKDYYFLSYSKKFPFNIFTTEFLLAREYKAYASLVRDIYHALVFNNMGRTVVYNYIDDLGGIDLFIDGVPVFGYTDSSKVFRNEKIKVRHPNLVGLGVNIVLDNKENKPGIMVMDDISAQLILDNVDELKEHIKKMEANIEEGKPIEEKVLTVLYKGCIL